MTNKQRKLILTIAVFSILAVADFLIKVLISDWLDHGESVPLAGEFFFLTNVYNARMAYGLNFNNDIDWISILTIFTKAVVSVVLVIILVRDTLYRFKLSAAMILFGWLAIQADHFFLARGRQGYVSMEYFYDNVFTGSATSISFFLVQVGWLLLLISMLTRFREFRRIFVRNAVGNAGIVR